MTGLTAAERVLFVVGATDGELLLREVGGSLLRLLGHGGSATVLYGTGTDGANADLEQALAEIGVDSVWFLEGEPSEEIPAVISALDADSLVIAAIRPGELKDLELRAAAVRSAAAAGIPAFVASHSGDEASDAATTQIDIRGVRAAKWEALGRLGTPALVATAEELPGSEGFLTVRPAPRELHQAQARPGLASRILACALAAAVGIVFGALGTVMHSAVWSIGPVDVPVGLVLALLAIAALLAGLRMVLRGRLVAVCAAVGVLVTVFVLSLRSSGGSVLVPDGLLGQVWTIGPAFIAALAVTWPEISRHPKHRPAASAAGHGMPRA